MESPTFTALFVHAKHRIGVLGLQEYPDCVPAHERVGLLLQYINAYNFNTTNSTPLFKNNCRFIKSKIRQDAISYGYHHSGN